MKHSGAKALYDYWNALRNGRVAPYRSEVDPREIANLLESTFILEVQSPDCIRFRLAGTRLCEKFGMELRGMSALALWHGDCRKKVRQAIGAVVDQPAIATLSCSVENRGGFVYDAEFLYMPLKSDTEERTRILGCGFYSGEDAAFAHLYAPIHHWIEDVQIHRIDGAREEAQPASRRRPHWRYIEKGATPLRLHDAAPDGPGLVAIEGGRKPDARKAPKPILAKRGHLRLVKDDAG